MKELRNKIFKIFEWMGDGNESYQYEAFDKVMGAIEDFFKQTGKQGGETTKKKTDYSALGKRGAASRWKHKHAGNLKQVPSISPNELPASRRGSERHGE